ncbi:hypothetical protein Tco_1365503 [Tanacetum coccineum]
MKAKLVLLEASPPTSQSSKPFQSKNKGLVAETFDWDEEEVYDDEVETRVRVLMALADDEFSMGKNHACNGEWIDITMKKVNILLSIDDDSDWQNYLIYINIDLKYVEEHRLNLLNHALQEHLKEERKVNEKWLNNSKKFNQCISEQILSQKMKILSCEQLTESSSKNDAKDNPCVPASLDYDHEIVPKSKD